MIEQWSLGLCIVILLLLLIASLLLWIWDDDGLKLRRK